MKVTATKSKLTLALTRTDAESLRYVLAAVVRTDWQDLKARNLGRYLAGAVEGFTGEPVEDTDESDVGSPVSSEMNPRFGKCPICELAYKVAQLIVREGIS